MASGQPPPTNRLTQRTCAAAAPSHEQWLSSEYKRLRTHDYSSCFLAGVAGQACRGGHVSVISKADFNATDFRQEALRMAHEWAAMFDSYDKLQAVHAEGFQLARFEHLTAPEQLARLQALAGILAALGVPRLAILAADEANDADELLGIREEVGGKHTREDLHSLLLGYEPMRLTCAFAAAKHPAIFRPTAPDAIDAQFVYAAGAVAGLVCDVWRVVGGRAAQHGYALFGAAVCPS
ncbi:hypothetical protein COO60DRAFT_532010 [Scenedesmus sp. NREL 46B-D3]|nr:hypothetical protein COO60DRAFT_532010 [Scenedesmus sp. NREL 46B-D3]